MRFLYILTCILISKCVLLDALRANVTDRPPPPKPPPPKPPPNPIAPGANINDTIAIILQHLGNSTKNYTRSLQGMKLTRDGGPGSFLNGGEAGSIFSQLNLILPLLLALASSPASASPPAPADPNAGPSPPADPNAPPPAPTPPASGLDPLALILALLSGDDPNGKGMDGNENMPSKSNCGQIKPGTICDPDVDIRNMLAFPDHILAIENDKVYRIGLEGEVLDHVGKPASEEFKKLNGTPVASLRVNYLYYIFFDDNTVTLFSNTSQIITPRQPVTDTFFGVRQPIKGAFFLNEHTITLFYDRHFVFYQPMSNPPIDPRYSPQPSNIIPDGPDYIDGTIEINNNKYLLRDGWLYEVSADEMKIVRKIPIRKTKDSGFINCKKYYDCNSSVDFP